MPPANERCRYNVTTSLIGWVHTQNSPGNMMDEEAGRYRLTADEESSHFFYHEAARGSAHIKISSMVPLQPGHFFPKTSQNTSHSSPIRARYGVSFVDWHSKIYSAPVTEVTYAMSCYIGLHYYSTRLCHCIIFVYLDLYCMIKSGFVICNQDACSYIDWTMYLIYVSEFICLLISLHNEI